MAESTKPKLLQHLEALTQVVVELQELSTDFSAVKRLLQSDLSQINAADLPQLSLTIPGLKGTVPVPGILLTPAQLHAVLDETGAELGERVLNAWAEAHQITTEANAHCLAAAQAAAQLLQDMLQGEMLLACDRNQVASSRIESTASAGKTISMISWHSRTSKGTCPIMWHFFYR